MTQKLIQLLPGLISASMIAGSLLFDIPLDRKLELIQESIRVGIELWVVFNNGKKDKNEETQKNKEISDEKEETQLTKEVSQDQQ